MRSLRKVPDFATDLNGKNLEAAREGIYHVKSMRQATQNYLLAGGFFLVCGLLYGPLRLCFDVAFIERERFIFTAQPGHGSSVWGNGHGRSAAMC